MKFGAKLSQLRLFTENNSIQVHATYILPACFNAFFTVGL